MQNKKNVAKRLGLKLSYMQDNDLYFYKDTEKLVFQYFYFENDNTRDHLVYYILDHTQNVSTGGDPKECSQSLAHSRFNEIIPRVNSGLEMPDFLIYSNDSKLVNILNGGSNDDQRQESIVIVDDIFNGLAINQQTKQPFLVLKLLKNDIDACLLQDISRKLQHNYQKIYVWSGNEAFRKAFLDHLDHSQLYIVHSELDAYTMLQEDSREKFALIEATKCARHPSILTFSDLKDEVFNELTNPTVNGVLWKRFPKFNEHLKGHRPGELTIVTGPTGCGKTTFVSEYSLDLCAQGVPTLWGSFEIKNVRLAKMMLTQYVQRSLVDIEKEEFYAEANQMNQLPLYFLKFHGQTEVNHVLEAAKHAVLTKGIKHLVIDNLQFMLGLNVDSSFDRFLKQDYLITCLRHFATANNCHITLVAHPRKEKEEIALNNNSLYGGVKASQEADNVMILMNKFNPRFKCNKYIQITKNRFNGSLGVVPLFFDKNTLCFAPKSKEAASDCQQQPVPKDEEESEERPREWTSYGQMNLYD